MRDLKADLEQVRDFRSGWGQSTSPEEAWEIGVAWEDFCQDKAELWLEQGIGEAERAEKAEALARELVQALEDVHPRAGVVKWIKRRRVLYKAKEVLGDGRE
jgi:hypothetical protein